MIGLTPRGVVRMYHVVHMYHHAGTSTNVLLPKSRRMLPESLQNVVIASSCHLAGVVVHLYHYSKVDISIYTPSVDIHALVPHIRLTYHSHKLY